MTAARTFNEIEQRHRGQPRTLANTLIVEVVEKALVQFDIGPRVEHHAVARQAIASGAADLLIPRLDVLRHVAVNHETHVRLVDAHPECDRRHDDVDVVALECFLVARPYVGFEARMIRQGAHALRRQELRGLIHAFAALAVHDAAFAVVRADERQNLGACVTTLPLLARRDLQVRPEKGALEPRRFAHAELPQDIERHAPGRGRGKRQHGNVELLLEPLQAAIRRAEVVPPLTDAVRLVDHQQRNRAVTHEVAEVTIERFGGEEHQLVLAGAKGVHARPPFVEIQRGVDRGDSESETRDGVYLVLHQRDERRNHQHRSLEQACRQLIRERLARSGRHQRDTILSRQHRVDDFALARAELVEPENIPEDAFGSA